jgi:hypothetical protein
MADVYASNTPSLTSPAIDGEMVAPNDSQPLGQVSRAIYVGGAGTISAELASGTQVTFSAVPAGTILPLRLRKVNATGTTASGIVALW